MIHIDQQSMIDSWHSKVEVLETLDYNIDQMLHDDQRQDSELSQLIAKRERLLTSITDILRRLPQLYQSSAWQQALTRTQVIVEEMEQQTIQLRLQAQRVAHGQQSLKQYQRFS